MKGDILRMFFDHVKARSGQDGDIRNKEHKWFLTADIIHCHLERQ